MKGLVLEEKGDYKSQKVQSDLPIPEPKQGEVLVKVEAIGINPVDWKMANIGFFIKEFPIVLGCDMSGTIEKVGPGITNFKQGDKVLAFTPLGTPGAGAFAEYCVTSAIFLMKRPDTMSAEQASTIPVGCLTAALGLFHSLGVSPEPASNRNESILIWGGSTNVGVYAIQLAKWAGFHVIATASSRNEELVKSLGADVFVNYREDDCMSKIQEASINGSLAFAMDTVSTETADLCLQAIGQTPNAKLAFVAGQPSSDPDNITISNVFLGSVYDSDDERKELLSKLCQTTIQDLMNEGKLKPSVVHKVEGGIDGIIDGLSLSAEGKVSGCKVVISL